MPNPGSAGHKENRDHDEATKFSGLVEGNGCFISFHLSVCAQTATDRIWIGSGHTAAVYACAFSPDGSILAFGSDDQTVKLWRVADGTLVRTSTGHAGVIRSVAFSPDRSMLASRSGQ